MNKEQIAITTGFIKLGDLLKFSGIAESGGQAKEFILDQIVSVNSEICIERGKKIYPGYIVFIDIEDGFELEVTAQ